MTAQAAPDVVVIGAGVIGLSTAVCLAERGQRVEVRARLAPAQTTQFSSLAEVAGTGVAIRRGRLASREAAPVPGNRTRSEETAVVCHTRSLASELGDLPHEVPNGG